MRACSVRLCTVACTVSLWSLPVHAWDPATTQAGLAEKAALASRVHHVLAVGLGRPLGLFEPVSVAALERDTPRMRLLWQRLELLSAAEGYRPANVTGANSGLGWIAAGAAIEGAPAERGRHHFFDPKTGRGLHDDPGPTGTLHSLKLAFDGRGGLRGLATGTTFDLTGRPALGWLLSADNDLGLPHFFAALENTVAAPSAPERQAALADALMCLGGMGAVLADMGDPAHVRNDFRGAFLGGGSAGSWDQASDFERFTSRVYGRAGVPEVAAVNRPSLASFFSAVDGMGLADRTQRDFFSVGTLPADISLEPASTPKRIRDEANQSLAYPEPRVARLSLRQGGRKYQKNQGVRQFAYERLGNTVRFFMDEGVYADVAQTWLPVVGGYVAGLYSHLLRAEAELSVKDEQGSRKLSVTLRGLAPGATGTLRLYTQSENGPRHEVGAPIEITALASGGQAPSFSFELPPDAFRVAVSLRGQDAAGAFVAVAERGAR